MKKVLFVTNYPSPYRVDFFNEFGSRNGIDLTVVFQEKAIEQDHRSIDWFHENYDFFTAIFLEKRIHLPHKSYVCPEIIELIKKKYDVVIYGGINYPTHMLGMEYMRLHHMSYCIEGDGAFAGKGKGLKERVKKHFISKANVFFSTSKAHDEYYKVYGANSSRIYRYPFTSISQKDIINAQSFISKGKKWFREKLGIMEEHIILSVGRFSYQNGYGKGFDTLMRVAEQLNDTAYGFYIVGDEPTDEFKEWKRKSNLTNVHFIGFKQKDQLAEYYAAADLFVLLSKGEAWGLVINEAMTYGLPVIATDRCVAGVELVRDGENGWLVPANNPDLVVQSIQKFINSNKEEMTRIALDTMREYTIEKMVDVHVEVLNNCYE